VRLEGSLDAFSLPDIFSLLSMTKKTGGLHLRRAGAHGAVWLADGLLTGGTSDVGRESLGRRIAGSGHVTDEALVDAVRQAAEEAEVGVARALRDAGAIDEGELHALVGEQIADAVFDLMRWPDGEFAFVVDEPNANDVGVAREVDEVVTEARRRLEVWETIDATVADPATVLALALEPGAEPTLSREEWALIALVDGSRTVGDLVAMYGRGDYSVVVALAELVGRGLLRANDAEGVAALVRRQELLATLESASPARHPAPTPRSVGEGPGVADDEPAVDPFPTSAEPVVETIDFQPATAVSSVVSRDGEPLDEDGDGRFSSGDVEVIAPVSPLARNAELAREIQAVMPQRPEPFMPSREPDHPEPLAAAAAGGGVVAGTVPAANPSGAIERDPSVNKSLLLRLIAGVRGL
jgi:hypothetical protein